MSNINKQELREAAERAESDSWGYDRDEFNEALTPSTVLALLDELEAKDSMIAAQQHEICTLLNALEGRPCPKCNDTGMADSGGTQPWGEPISVPCDCAAPPAPVSVPDGRYLCLMLFILKAKSQPLMITTRSAGTPAAPPCFRVPIDHKTKRKIFRKIFQPHSLSRWQTCTA